MCFEGCVKLRVDERRDIGMGECCWFETHHRVDVVAFGLDGPCIAFAWVRADACSVAGDAGCLGIGPNLADRCGWIWCGLSVLLGPPERLESRVSVDRVVLVAGGSSRKPSSYSSAWMRAGSGLLAGMWVYLSMTGLAEQLDGVWRVLRPDVVEVQPFALWCRAFPAAAFAPSATSLDDCVAEAEQTLAVSLGRPAGVDGPAVCLARVSGVDELGAAGGGAWPPLLASAHGLRLRRSTMLPAVYVTSAAQAASHVQRRRLMGSGLDAAENQGKALQSQERRCSRMDRCRGLASTR